MDPATIVPLAAAAVKLLAPYLQSAAKTFAEHASDDVGAAASAKVKQLWEAIHVKLHGKPAAKEALDDLAQSPDDPDAQAALRTQLKKALETDDAFAAELTNLLKEAHAQGADAVFNTQIGGDVQKVANIGTVQGNVQF